MLRSFCGGRLFGDVTGSTGRVSVVGLHGWGRDRRDLLPSLHGLDAVSFDLPGFGASPPPSESTGARGYAALIVEALDELGVGPVVAIGHSFGGRVAVCAAAARPDTISGLVLTGVPLLRSTGAGAKLHPAYRFARWLHRFGVLGDPRMERFRQRYGSRDYRAVSGVMRDVLVIAVNESYEEELRRLRCGAELVWGSEDRIVPPAIADRAAELIADAEVRILPGVGHLVPSQAPAALHAAAVHLLAQPARS